MYYLYHVVAWGIPLGVVIAGLHPVCLTRIELKNQILTAYLPLLVFDVAGLASEQMEAQQASIVCWMKNPLDWALIYSLCEYLFSTSLYLTM